MWQTAFTEEGRKWEKMEAQVSQNRQKPDTLKQVSKKVACLIPIHVFLCTFDMFPRSVWCLSTSYILPEPRNMCDQFSVTQGNWDNCLDRLQHLQLKPVGVELWLIGADAGWLNLLLGM